MSFREWTRQLRGIRGNQPLWPWLMGAMLDAEFQRQREQRDSYQEDVFKDRDDTQPQDGDTERRLVATLYHRCRQNSNGIIRLNDEEIWLLGYEWPTQGGDREKGCRADLVGVNSLGGLVVFECKRSDNSDPPLTAVVEGLDYLACLLRGDNFQKIIAGFDAWRMKPGKIIPAGFEAVGPNSVERPMLVVLAPELYFVGRYTRSKRGEGWADLAELANDVIPSVRLGFASCDFEAPVATLL